MTLLLNCHFKFCDLSHNNMIFFACFYQGSTVPADAFPTVDVPDHAHYTIGVVILAVGITGMVGNFLVIYAFSR